MSYQPTQGRPRKMVFGMRLRGFQSTFLRTGICEGNLGGAHSCRRTAHLASPVLTGCERLISLPCCPVSRTPVPSHLPALLVAPAVACDACSRSVRLVHALIFEGGVWEQRKESLGRSTRSVLCMQQPARWCEQQGDSQLPAQLPMLMPCSALTFPKSPESLDQIDNDDAAQGRSGRSQSLRPRQSCWGV